MLLTPWLSHTYSHWFQGNKSENRWVKTGVRERVWERLTKKNTTNSTANVISIVCSFGDFFFLLFILRSYFLLIRCRAKRRMELRLKKEKHGFPILVYFKSTSHPAYFHNLLLWTVYFIISLYTRSWIEFIFFFCWTKKCWCAYALYVINFV